MVVCERCFPFDRFGGSTPSQTLAIPFSIFLRRFYQDSDLCAADPRSRSKSIRFICNNSVASHRIVCFVFHSLIIFIGDVVFRNVGIINLFEAFLALPASSRLEIFLSFFTIFSLICVWIRNRILYFITFDCVEWSTFTLSSSLEGFFPIIVVFSAWYVFVYLSWFRFYFVMEFSCCGEIDILDYPDPFTIL